MKLFFAIFLMSTVLLSEVANIIDITNTDIILLDISLDGESEKEASENIEDLSKEKIKQNVNLTFASTNDCLNDLFIKWPVSASYLEIHIPPPDQV